MAKRKSEPARYKWLQAKAGRSRGHIETLDPRDGVTCIWLGRKWIERQLPPVEVKPKPKPAETKDVPVPPVHRALRTGDFPTR